MLPQIEELIARIEASVPGARLELIPNDSPANQPSILLNSEAALAVARFLRDDPDLRLDYASNVTGVDWLEAVLKEKFKVKKTLDGVEKEVEETRESKRPGYLEVIYHLYSMELKHGPVVIRLRAQGREHNPPLPSLTPIWRGAEFQEREIFDLYGVHFDGHPDLRRLLMWEGYEDHPMRKDYIEPDDYEYEPTPHDDVLAKAKSRSPSVEGITGR
jgi:NADH-quinone oxidoreductase subunit C